MDDITVIQDWLELETLCASVGWFTSIRTGDIALHANGIVAHKTKSVESALGFIQGYIAGTKEDK